MENSIATINEGRPVYFSYARNSSRKPEWEHISDCVDTLLNTMTANGLEYRVDVRDIGMGDKISKFEEEIGWNSEVVVIIFSDKYFRSLHCMYEFVQIKKALEHYPEKRLMCIKSGDFNLADFNYIRDLERYWNNQKIEYEDIEFHRIRKHSGTEIAAHENGFYLDDIRELYSFFSAINYSNAASINYDGFVGDIVRYYRTTPKPKLTPKPKKSTPQPPSYTAQTPQYNAQPQPYTAQPQPYMVQPQPYTAQPQPYITQPQPMPQFAQNVQQPVSTSQPATKKSSAMPIVFVIMIVVALIAYFMMGRSKTFEEYDTTDEQTAATAEQPATAAEQSPEQSKQQSKKQSPQQPKQSATTTNTDKNGSVAANGTKTDNNATKTDKNGHSYVDLGLPSGTLWATCNIGAKAPEKFGDYYAWGETKTKSSYSWDNYKYCKDGDEKQITKYCSDGRTTLERSDDVAYQKWGSDWCVPTKEQVNELKDKCTWTWTARNGNKGYEVKGSNGNSIFLPAASDLKEKGLSNVGLYWSSSLERDHPYNGDCLIFGYEAPTVFVEVLGGNRCDGVSVRPVRCKQ